MRATPRALFVAVIATLVGCGAGGDGGSVPDAIRAVAQHREVEPWRGWSLPGVTLYRMSFAVPDRSESSIVGLDRATGAVVSGADLMRRIGPQPPEVRAQRVCDVLLGRQGGQPLTSADRHSFGTDAEWAEVVPARVEGEALIFFALQGDMAPELVEHRVSTETWAVTTRPVVEVIVASGRRAAVGGPRCMPHIACGCWNDCAPFQLVRVPDRSPDELLFVVGDLDGALYAPRHDCRTIDGRERCLRMCRADSLSADCDDAVVRENEACAEACAPGEAPYHCELYEDGCRRVEHPIRVAASVRAP